MLNSALFQIKKLTKFEIKLKKRVITFWVVLFFYLLSYLLTNRKEIFQVSFFNWKALWSFTNKDDIVLKTQASNDVLFSDDNGIKEAKQLNIWIFSKDMAEMKLLISQINKNSFDPKEKMLQPLGPSQKLYDFFGLIDAKALLKTKEFWGNNVFLPSECEKIQKIFSIKNAFCSSFLDWKEHLIDDLFSIQVYEISNTYFMIRLINQKSPEKDRATMLFDKQSNQYLLLNVEKIGWTLAYYDWILYFFDKNYFLKTSYNIVTKTYKNYERINQEKTRFLGFNKLGRLIGKEVDGEKILKLDWLPVVSDRYLKYMTVDWESGGFALIDQSKNLWEIKVYYGYFENNKVFSVKKYITLKANLPIENCSWNINVKIKGDNLFVYPLKKQDDNNYCWGSEIARFNIKTEDFLFKTNSVETIFSY